MSDPQQPEREARGRADQTLLGVAPPRVDTDSPVEHRLHSPVLVRSGTSVADVEQPGIARSGQLVENPVKAPNGAAHVAPASPTGSSASRASFDAAFAYVRSRPAIWMMALPVLCSLALIALLRHPARARTAVTGQAVFSPAAAPEPHAAPAATATLAELERRPVGLLSAKEVVLLAQARAQQKRSAAGALREQLERDPALGKDGAMQKELLHLTTDPLTAPDALAALAVVDPPIGGDLLYEVWTGTTQRTETTELARAILYSTDVRPKASPALAVALDLRDAESCEQYQLILPKALTDGDRRALHLLTKLNGKRGCGAKKNEDCFACLRSNSAQLAAAIGAVKGRRAPTLTGQ